MEFCRASHSGSKPCTHERADADFSDSFVKEFVNKDLAEQRNIFPRSSCNTFLQNDLPMLSKHLISLTDVYPGCFEKLGLGKVSCDFRETLLSLRLSELLSILTDMREMRFADRTLGLEFLPAESPRHLASGCEIYEPTRQEQMLSKQTLFQDCILRKSLFPLDATTSKGIICNNSSVSDSGTPLILEKRVTLPADSFRWLQDASSKLQPSMTAWLCWSDLPSMLVAQSLLPSAMALGHFYHSPCRTAFSVHSASYDYLSHELATRAGPSSKLQTSCESILQRLLENKLPVSSALHRLDSYRAGSCWSEPQCLKSCSFDWKADCSYESATLLRVVDVHSMTMIPQRKSKPSEGTRVFSSRVDSGGTSPRQTKRALVSNLEEDCRGLEKDSSEDFDTDFMLDFEDTPAFESAGLLAGGKGGLQAFIGLRKGASASCNPPVGLPDVQKSFPEEVNKEGARPKLSPSYISAPSSVPIAKPDFDLAQKCLVAKRCFILLPPPVCALASILLVANSYLRDDQCDHRVLLLCMGLSEATTRSVFDYARSFLSETGKLLKLADRVSENAASDAASMVVASGIGNLGERDLAVQFSYIAVLVPSTVTEACEVGSDKTTVMENAKFSELRTRASTVVFALYPYLKSVNLLAMVEWMQRARDLFCVNLVVFQNPLTEVTVQARTALLKNSNIFVVLPAAAQEALEVLEEAAFPLLRLTAEYETTQPMTLLSTKIAALHEALKKCRADHSSPEARRRLQNLVLLNTMKRALTFCLNDSLQKGSAFISEAASRYPNSALGKCSARLSEIERRWNGAKAMLARHRVDRVRSLMRAELQGMLRECHATKALRLQKTYKVLVIADSSAAVEYLLKSLDGAVEVEKLEMSRLDDTKSPRPASLFVAHFEQLGCSSTSNSAAIKYFSQFSHVIHLASVSAEELNSSFAPVPVLQLSHAGCLRLVTIQVDVRRELEKAEKAAESLFTNLCLREAKLGEKRGDIDGVKDILLSLREDNSSAAVESTEKGVHHVDIAIGLLARHDSEWISGTLFAKLSEMSAKIPSGSRRQGLELRVHVSSGMGTHVACKQLHDAICSHRHLLDHVTVLYVMEDIANSDSEVPYRPSKRLKLTQ